MFGRWLLVAVAMALVVGCARPRYMKGAADSGGDGFEKLGVCADRFEVSGLCVTWKWETRATLKAPGIFLFKVYRLNLGDGSVLPVEVAGPVKVELFMPKMGHGSTPVTVTAVDTGTFRASRVNLFMRGPWEIRFQMAHIDSSNKQIEDRAAIAYEF